MPPETRYARSGAVNIAYQVVGDGPFDLLYVPGWVSHVEEGWEEPSVARFLSRLASFSRLILFDKRGTGLSDRVPEHELPTLEQRMDDVRAVFDAVGLERAALLGYSEGGPMCALFAATYPERTLSLVLYGSFAKRLSAPDYPWGIDPGDREKEYEFVEREWGQVSELSHYAPSVADDEEFMRRMATYRRRSASPGAAVALMRMNSQVDIRSVLPVIGVPTLVLHRTGDRDVSVGNGRYLGEHIPAARYVELPGEDHMPFVGDADAVLDEIEEFLTGVRRGPDPDRVLVTLLFTDIVGSTDRAARLGDRAWRDLVERHHALVRSELERWQGREIDTAGDGFLAEFGGPARAVRCAQAVVAGVRSLGLAVRAGVHTGEAERAGDALRGIAVHIGARVAATAAPGEVLVSGTVKDLVSGSGIEFDDRGEHPLKGVPGSHRLFAAVR
ncbi:MAG: adenylate/guanylate cyclase domain-containing protein [Gaiellaceae bacterium]